jgi:hypothetical protein
MHMYLVVVANVPTYGRVVRYHELEYLGQESMLGKVEVGMGIVQQCGEESTLSACPKFVPQGYMPVPVSL